MSLDQNALSAKSKMIAITTTVSPEDPLVRLCNTLDWAKMRDIVLADLMKTEKGLYQVGRQLVLRMHLGCYALQSLKQWKDRETEEMIEGTPRHQVFCGRGVVENWHVPDYTAITKFRNRLTPETHRELALYIAQEATQLGFAKPGILDVDSTVQEANMAYPADANLLLKLAWMCRKGGKFLEACSRYASRSNLKEPATETANTANPAVINTVENVVRHCKEKWRWPTPPAVNIKVIKEKAREYLFLPKNKARAIKEKYFRDLYDSVVSEVTPMLEYLSHLPESFCIKLPWNIQRTITQLCSIAPTYLEDVMHFIKTHTVKKGKRLSFHLQMVACITKGKLGKPYQFGRVYQIGRIGGNYTIFLPSTSVNQPDAAAIMPMVKEHQRIFGEGVLQSIAADKAYYSHDNVTKLRPLIAEVGISVPRNIKRPPSDPVTLARLRDRRAGIEPIIGHLKLLGLGRSRMKTDTTGEAEAYRSALASNLRHLMRDLTKNEQKIAA